MTNPRKHILIVGDELRNGLSDFLAGIPSVDSTAPLIVSPSRTIKNVDVALSEGKKVDLTLWRIPNSSYGKKMCAKHMPLADVVVFVVDVSNIDSQLDFLQHAKAELDACNKRATSVLILKGEMKENAATTKLDSVKSLLELNKSQADLYFSPQSTASDLLAAVTGVISFDLMAPEPEHKGGGSSDSSPQLLENLLGPSENPAVSREIIRLISQATRLVDEASDPLNPHVSEAFKLYLNSLGNTKLALNMGKIDLAEALEQAQEALALTKKVVACGKDDAAVIASIFTHAFDHITDSSIMQSPFTQPHGATLQTLLKRASAQTIKDLPEIGYADAQAMAISSLALAQRAASGRVTEQDALHFSNENGVAAAQSKAILLLIGKIIGAVLGLAIGITLGAMIGAGLGPGAAWSALAAGKKGAVIGGLVGGTIAGTIAGKRFYTTGEQVSFWNHPLPKMATEATNLARKLKQGQ